MANKRTHDEMAGAKPPLQRLYETGEWSDLTIEASNGKLFKVHKAVICPASAYFRAACTRAFSESATNIIKLSCSEKIVDALLRHMYECPAEWARIPRPLAPEAVNGSVSEEFVLLQALGKGLHLILLRVAAYEYNVTSMVASVEATFDHLVTNLNDNTSLVSIGHFAFKRREDVLEQMRHVVLERTAEKVPEIFADKTMFDLLCQNMEYLRQAVLASSGRGGGDEGRGSKVKSPRPHVRAGGDRWP